MAAPVTQSKIVRPYVHSLSHLAATRLAISLCTEIDSTTLIEVYYDITQGISQGKHLRKAKIIKLNWGKEMFLSIPQHLRKRVYDTAKGLNYSAFVWRLSHSKVVELVGKDCVFYWKADGTVDGQKTAQNLVLNSNRLIDIKSRFHLACQFCLEDSIRILWAEMKRLGQTKNLETSENCMVRFWVRRMRNKSRVPWERAVQQYFKNPRNCHKGARYSIFFPSLQPEERSRFLTSLDPSDIEDYLLCVYAMTKEEENELLKNPLIILCAYLDRPLRSFFVAIAEKLLDYVGESDFCYFLNTFIFPRMAWERYDYYELFASFWNVSPISLRESVKQFPDISDKVDSCFNYLMKKRKAALKIGNSKKKKSFTF